MDKYLYLDSLRVRSAPVYRLMSIDDYRLAPPPQQSHLLPITPMTVPPGLQRPALLRAAGAPHGRAPPHRLHADGRPGLPLLLPHLHAAVRALMGGRSSISPLSTFCCMPAGKGRSPIRSPPTHVHTHSPKGLFISLKDKGRVKEILQSWPAKEVQVIGACVSQCFLSNGVSLGPRA